VVLDGFLNELCRFLVPLRLEVSQGKPVEDVAVLGLNFEAMPEPPNGILELAYLLEAASDVIQQLLALRVLSRS